MKNITSIRLARFLGIISVIVTIASCASFPTQNFYHQDLYQPYTAYLPKQNSSPFETYAPLVVPENFEFTYNRIGRPQARLEKGKEKIFVDPTSPVFYVQEQFFTTESGAYRNLIYRIHFEYVPYSLIPFHITAGANSGLFIVITLNNQNHPLLVTTVHTCGCYLAMVPTNFLPRQSYPEKWTEEKQEVYGEQLPGKLIYPRPFDLKDRLLIELRDGTHRVKDIYVKKIDEDASDYNFVQATIEPIEKLKTLPLGDGVTSFYYDKGPYRGYVKNSFKPFEMLLMGWWTLDPRVGTDKELGDSRETGTVFYTSLKPWNRKKSDMWNFPAFLKFWGWNL